MELDGNQFTVAWKHLDPYWLHLKGRKNGLMVRLGDERIFRLTAA